VTGHPLDSALWSALTGPHRELAEVRGAAARYRPDVGPFAALAGGPGTTDLAAWADLAVLVGPGGEAVVSGDEAAPPVGWRLVAQIPGLQFDGSGVDVRPDDEALALGADDVPEMLDLVARTRPGPFRQETHRMGGYLGIRLGGALIAMAGQRMHPPGWTEISAVCTDPDHRGKGLAERLVRAVAAGIRDRGDVPFLHVAAENTGAIRLYERMGFTLRREVQFSVVRAPG
jgi:ribosomal protein S18 acetylase RimI-like enzyme